MKWLKSLSLSVAAGAILAMLVGSQAMYNEVKANTMQNKLDVQYNLKTEAMYETLIRIDENVKYLKANK